MSAAPVVQPRPMRWLNEASADEIAEALFAVDPRKAAEVVALVVGRVGPKLAASIDRAIEKAQEDPARTLFRAGVSVLRSFSGD